MKKKRFRLKLLTFSFTLTGSDSRRTPFKGDWNIDSDSVNALVDSFTDRTVETYSWVWGLSALQLKSLGFFPWFHFIPSLPKDEGNICWVKEDIFPPLTFFLYLSVLPSFPPSECEFSGNIGSQEELCVCAAGLGPAVRPAAVPDAGAAHQGDGPKGWESGQAHADPWSSR